MTRDQFLTEKVLGGCWHTSIFPFSYGIAHCDKCNAIFKISEINFSTSEGFFRLWNFCKEQVWWQGFLTPYTMDRFSYARGIDEIYKLINPDTFADEIARYRGWEGE